MPLNSSLSAHEMFYRSADLGEACKECRLVWLQERQGHEEHSDMNFVLDLLYNLPSVAQVPYLVKYLERIMWQQNCYYLWGESCPSHNNSLIIGTICQWMFTITAVLSLYHHNNFILSLNVFL